MLRLQSLYSVRQVDREGLSEEESQETTVLPS